ncbi:hypothetical protein O5190_27475, partial [Escherichia coli]|nr:hypothetical protein [Escherichia coli]
GLRKSIPLVYLCFLVGGAALSAFIFRVLRVTCQHSNGFISTIGLNEYLIEPRKLFEDAIFCW